MATSASKRKQDEKHLKMLREIVALPHNKQCFDCHQRGPTYVNMTVGSFVCTSCSGILRGLNPPHRVKSISMATFTPEEMEFLKSRGNEFCKKVWLARFNPSLHREPDSKDEHRVKEFMSEKYEKKRFYVEPTEELHAEAKQMNTPPAKPDAKQLRSLAGNSLPVLKVDQNKPAVPSTLQTRPPMPASSTTQPTTLAPPASTATPAHNKPAGFDLLGDLGGDPFAGPVNKAGDATVPASTTGFADFSAFGSGSAVTSPPQTTPTFPSGGGGGGGAGLLQPMNTASQPPSSAAPNGVPSSLPVSSQMSTSAASDKYAALASLDSALGGGGTNPPVNWDGTPSGTGSIWNSAGSSGTAGIATNSAAGFAGVSSTSASNPFGTTPAQFGTSPQNAATTPGGNPFLGGGFAQQPAAFSQFQATPSTGFAAFPAATVAPVNTVSGQAYGVQNGGFGTSAVTTQAGFGVPGFAAAPGQFPPQGGVLPPGGGQFVAKMAPAPMAHPGGQGQQHFGAWTQSTTGNPFMAPAAQQAVPPRGSSTNPFL